MTSILKAATIALICMLTSAHAADPMKLTFGDREYVHRWSKDGQHEFTPPSEPDLKKWQHMVTVNIHDKVRNGDQLAQLANVVSAFGLTASPESVQLAGAHITTPSGFQPLLSCAE